MAEASGQAKFRVEYQNFRHWTVVVISIGRDDDIPKAVHGNAGWPPHLRVRHSLRRS